MIGIDFRNEEVEMMKKLKWILIALVVIVLAGGGYALYLFKFKQYDVADQKVDAVIEEGYEVTLPNGSVIKLDKEGNVIEESGEQVAVKEKQSPAEQEQGAAQQPTRTDAESAAGSDSASAPQTSSPTVEPTVASIKESYRVSFEGLEGQADAKLNNLLAMAKNEYLAKLAAGEDISFGYFYQKYTAAAAGLETSTDAVFNALYAALQQELKANGFSASYAQSFKEEYEASKEARRNSVLSKIQESL